MYWVRGTADNIEFGSLREVKKSGHSIWAVPWRGGSLARRFPNAFHCKLGAISWSSKLFVRVIVGETVFPASRVFPSK